jgi:hypothetical protein
MGSNPIGPTGSARLGAQLAEDTGQSHGPAHAGDGLLDLLGARDDALGPARLGGQEGGDNAADLHRLQGAGGVADR